MCLARFAPLAFTIACSANVSNEATGANASALLNGAADTSTSSVIAVFAHLPTGDEMCTGFLIAPDLVVTARHCAAPVDSTGTSCAPNDPKTGNRAGAPLAARDVWTSPDPVISETSKVTMVKEVLVVPDSTGGPMCGADVALLRLTKAMPDAKPFALRLDAGPAGGEPFTGVGYGVWDPAKPDDSGTRRILSGLAVEAVGTSDHTVDGEWIADRGPCAGDSGSPAIGADGAVFGVMSRGTKATCLSMIYERVDVHAAWLRAEAKKSYEALGQPSPGWVEGKKADAPVEPPTGAPGADAGPAPSAPAPASSGCSASPRHEKAPGSAVWLALALAGLFARARRPRR